MPKDPATLASDTSPGCYDLFDAAAIRAEVDAHLAGFLQDQAESACGGRLPTLVTDILARFLRGGKRLRPLLCTLGSLAAGGCVGPPVIAVAASLEMFHAFALIHDDVMDRSATRRGAPTVQQELAGHYLAQAPRRSGSRHIAQAAAFGNAGAILIGDLALVWSVHMLAAAGLDAHRFARTRTVINEMHHDVIYGQWLDLHAVGGSDSDVETPLSVIRYKTAKYSVERPLHLGAVLADAPPAALKALTTYALPIGEAFQLRDDLLGVFGDPSVTGKPVTDDLREGRRTLLLATAHALADPDQRRILARHVGDPLLTEHGASAVRTVLNETGAPEHVERRIATLRDEALRGLDDAPITTASKAELRTFAHHMTERTA
ncbi:polyprenyl synthetase family protein [Streptomyces sp. FIT100]|uniref:polyprenyl synthetase family protein n=1 Tax=Streptomyces sp. FIT100 TaxID=2837956 RepID=UPI0021C9EDBF|nr:polyprenyl synthetase family protein [Streptomyces sp. FIT100]UUN26751.1 polyprenyl synthetase family protein [Streptomyces sp. FIT100]